jgi:hypothetical protein
MPPEILKIKLMQLAVPQPMIFEINKKTEKLESPYFSTTSWKTPNPTNEEVEPRQDKRDKHL